MKKALLTFAIACAGSLALNSQVLYLEDFDGIGGPTAGGAGTYSFAPGMLLRNVDNRTPATNVAYVNEAWERREDFSFNVADSCAFSTSWYTPAGAANDWMWTPLISGINTGTTLSWNAVTYDPLYQDGYEVRIMIAASGPPTGGTGVLGNQVSGSTVVFSTAAEASAWTTHSVSLSAFAGQSVYVAFRNNATDKFLLLIDDIQVFAPVVNDARITFADTVTPYTIVPLAQVQPLTFTGTIANNGTNTITNVYVSAEVFDGVGNPVYNANSPTIPSLAAAATSSFTVAGFAPTASDFYYGRMIVHHSVTDPNTTNDTVYWGGYVVDDSVYARDDGNVTGGLGIGAGNGGYLGQDFQIVASDQLTQVLVYVTAGYTGEPLAAVIWNMSGGLPTTIAAYTDTILYPDDSARVYLLPMDGGPFTIAPGDYAVTFVEFDSTMQLGQTMSLFTGDHTWVNWPTSPFGGWANLEAFGAGFMRAQVIRPIFGDVCANNTATATSAQASCLTCADGTTSVTTSGTDGSLTYSWSPSGGNAATATGLLTGTYIITVTDGFGCATMDTVFVAYDVCGLFAATMSSTDASCATCPDGAAQVVVTGSNGPLTYVWSNGGTADTIQNVMPGTYTVTVTDSLGCTSTDTVIVDFSLDIAGLNAPGAVGVFPNPSNGAFQVDVNLAQATDLTIFVTNVLGEVVATKSVSGVKNGRIDMNLVDVASGVYAVHIRTNDNEKVISINVE
ncbi:MAG TPA: choice-of-anchor J domain-containing protein [Bacteroidia bacterium]|nr:choice-of-anchor J domain-containing protein [Bacteroidia bacterium]